jgi:hypothetical protein
MWATSNNVHEKNIVKIGEQDANQPVFCSDFT